jgi:Tfp pilus assembly protein PilF
MNAKGMGQLDQAEAAFKKAVAADPNNEKAHYDLAWVLALEGKKGDAKTEFQTVLSLTKDPTHKDEATRAIKRLGG